MIKITVEADRSDLDFIPELVPTLAPHVKLVQGTLKRASGSVDMVLEQDGKQAEAQVSLSVNDA